MSNTKDKKSIPVAFAAIDQYVQQNIVESTEREVKGRDYIEWGDRNAYPSYLYRLYKTVPSLKSAINGSVEYVCGNAVNVSSYPQKGAMNKKLQKAAEFVHDLALSYWRYGGFAIQVIRTRTGEIAELYSVDLRNLRSSKDNEVFFYSEEWDKGSGRIKALSYPKFMPEAREVASSILYVKNTSDQTYPEPIYGASVEACEIERAIKLYNLNAAKNGFAGGTIINFGDSEPEDAVKDEIEKNVNEKFAGPGNGGRIMLTWSDGKERAVSVETLEVQDFAEKYGVAAKESRQMIFTSFRANPNLFGIPTENLGFSAEEYKSTFELYNRTQIMPAQRLICESVGKIFGREDYMTIVPFTLEG